MWLEQEQSPRNSLTQQPQKNNDFYELHKALKNYKWKTQQKKETSEVIQNSKFIRPLSIKKKKKKKAKNPNSPKHKGLVQPEK